MISFIKRHLSDVIGWPFLFGGLIVAAKFSDFMTPLLLLIIVFVYCLVIGYIVSWAQDIEKKERKRIK